MDYPYATEVEDDIASPPERDTYTTLEIEFGEAAAPLKKATHPPATYARGDG
jgi:hypothetical protein